MMNKIILYKAPQYQRWDPKQKMNPQKRLHMSNGVSFVIMLE